jgi:hypothetical protein
MTPPRRSDAADLVAALAPLLPLRLGSLRVWGDWFGRPMDNIHTATPQQYQNHLLTN